MKSKNRGRNLLGMLVVVAIIVTATWQLGWLPVERWDFVVGESVDENGLSEEDEPIQDAPPTIDVILGDATLPMDEAEIVAPNEPPLADTENSAAKIIADSPEVPENESEAAKTDSAVTLVADSQPAKPREISQQQIEEVTHLIDEGHDKEAHEILSKWYWSHPKERARFQKEIETLAKSLYLSPQPLYEEPYVIQSGDQLRKIAPKYKLSWKYLARLNRINPQRIRVGQKLKVVHGPFDVVVELSDFGLTVVHNRQFVRHYRVGIGKDGTSPLGKFKVKEKLEDPTYYGPDGVIANDDPNNPLGERWIDIGDSFGIHGTIDSESIGKSESRGCIRMLNEDVAEVYDFLTVGSTVWIRR